MTKSVTRGGAKAEPQTVDEDPLYQWSKLSAAKWEDAWEERLCAYPGLVISGLIGRPQIRVEVYSHSRDELDALSEEWGGRVREIKSATWQRRGLQAVRAPLLKIRQSLVVIDDPEQWEKQRQTFPQRQVICIPSQMAFGTGGHATTATCLRMLADWAAARDAGWQMLDAGCGSAILAIAGMALGAQQAQAWDYDAKAIEVAGENLERHNYPRHWAAEKDMLEWEPEPEAYDLICANLYGDVLIELFEVLAIALRPEGRLIISGMMEHQAEACLARAKQEGWSVEECLQRSGWTTARLYRA